MVFRSNTIREAELRARVTICVLTYGDYPHLAKQVLGSIMQHCARYEYRLVVGANAVCGETMEWLQSLNETGEIDRLISSPTNLSKCPMMRQMFAGIETEYIWWFDDDSYITDPNLFRRWVGAADSSPASTVLWGPAAYCGHPKAFADVDDAVGFVRSASWYQGLPPPSWRLGGGGEFDFEEMGVGNGRWQFVLGGAWLIRTSAVRALDWPDPRLLRSGDDVFLGEAIRQHGWSFGNMDQDGVAINTESRRGRSDSVNIRSSTSASKR